MSGFGWRDALLAGWFCLAALPGAAQCTSPIVLNGSGGLTSGHLVYQSRTANDASQLYLYDFATETLQEISNGWTGVAHARNPHFRPDGQWITFTAIKNHAFNVFVWNPGLAQPIDLTPTADRSEDPKFSFDGNLIVFKKTGDIWVMRLDFDGTSGVTVTETKALTTGGALNGTYQEASAPFLAPDNSYVVFFRGNDDMHSTTPERLSVLALDPATLDPGAETVLTNDPGTYEYYPIIRQSGALFSVRHTETDRHDEIYVRAPSYAAAPARLSTNDCVFDNSDPTPVGSSKIIFSNDASGRYLLYLGNFANGKVWNFSDQPLINSPPHDLEGASYTPN